MAEAVAPGQASPAPVAAQQPNATAADWIAVAAGSLGALLATLDISITNSALPQIQGQIGAAGTEGTWVSTGYLMAEIVIIPLTAWLTRVFGLRRFLMWNALLFTAFSMVCGMSHSLPQMVIGRIGQGLAGGAMIPTAQTIVRTRLPRHQMPIGMSMFGLIVLLGPLLGPVVGGWLAENINWRWCFFLNVPITAVLVPLLYFGLKAERADVEAFFKADWLGIVGLTIGLSSLTVVLEEGQREQWFESQFIVYLSMLSAIGLTMMLVSQFTAKQPIVRLRLLLNRSYASVILIVTTVGAGLYGVSYLLPQFLSLIAGYNAEQAGGIMLLSGLPAFLLMPVLPRILGKFDSRWLVISGLVCFFASCMLDIGLTVDSVGHDFTVSQILRGFGQILAMMPLNQASMAAVATHEAGDAAGLYNMARNLGGSIGLALLGTLIDRRNAYHDSVIRESVTANSSIGQDHMTSTIAGFVAQGGDFAHAQLQAVAQLSGEIARQAAVMTFSETFFALGIALLCCVPLALLLKPPRPGAPVSSGH
ncbi:MFS transporter, DHA2 family, multidrug resistance protein [Ralstonia sp. 25mfcol4.1]|uniref:MDR family MFS transporter n=1 Tax=Burkholderiaceae TaxID=119060 RepID=UPI000883C21A|nr:MDR family MFS transporter [Ralstonia sp. 25mfcol4.1]SDP07118.1 MFS transporter, DHA2 family, multidrug resistance protein [Ralstonia sp. 25mfcol4.1]